VAQRKKTSLPHRAHLEMEIFKPLLGMLIIFLTHVLMYVLGRSSGLSKGRHEGAIRAKEAYDAREKARPYLHDTIPNKKEIS